MGGGGCWWCCCGWWCCWWAWAGGGSIRGAPGVGGLERGAEPPREDDEGGPPRPAGAPLAAPPLDGPPRSAPPRWAPPRGAPPRGGIPRPLKEGHRRSETTQEVRDHTGGQRPHSTASHPVGAANIYKSTYERSSEMHTFYTRSIVTRLILKPFSLGLQQPID